MDFAEYLKSTAKKIDKEVNKILRKQLKEAKKTDKKLVPLIKAFISSCQGGKGIRGALVKLGYEIATHLPGVKAHLGGEVIRVAAAYEIFHTAILIHDDIIDRSPIRRGKPSLYKELGGNHYGVSQAISVGDYGFFLAFKIISESSFPPDRKIQALELFSKVMMDTTWGEMLDLEETDPKVVMQLKTACYTISGPLQTGAVLAGAEEKLISTLGKFGGNIGMAFQIKDDILDQEVDYLGSVDQAKEEAEEYTNQAMKVLPEIVKDPKMSKLLEQMGEYLVNRKK